LSSKVNAAVDRAIADGIVVVTAAGNNNKDACSYSPGSTPSAINVAASDENDARWSWANYGKCVDIFAPGANVLSAWATSPTASKTLKGTSHAAPHVTGVAALALQNSPALSVTDVTSLIVSSATSDAITDAGVGSPNKLLYAPLSGSSSAPAVTTTTSTTIVKEIDNGTEVPSSTSVTVAVTKTSEGYEIAVESSLPGTKMQISALAKAKSSFTWTKTSSASGAVKFTTTRNLSGYNVIVLVGGAPYSSIAVG
jgi:subtilisin family serine protease